MWTHIITHKTHIYVRVSMCVHVFERVCKQEPVDERVVTCV